VIDLVGRSDLIHAPLVEDDDAVGQSERLALVVRDVHEGRPDSRWMRRSSTSISSRILRSSAESGSSSSSTRGRLTSARASAMRCI